MLKFKSSNFLSSLPCPCLHRYSLCFANIIVCVFVYKYLWVRECIVVITLSFLQVSNPEETTAMNFDMFFYCVVFLI